MRLHTCIYEGMKVLCSHGTREEKKRTAFKRQAEDRARRVRRVANWMRRDSRTGKFLRGGSREFARNSRPDRRTIPARLVRVLARRVGQEGWTKRSRATVSRRWDSACDISLPWLFPTLYGPTLAFFRLFVTCVYVLNFDHDKETEGGGSSSEKQSCKVRLKVLLFMRTSLRLIVTRIGWKYRVGGRVVVG